MVFCLTFSLLVLTVFSVPAQAYVPMCCLDCLAPPTPFLAIIPEALACSGGGGDGGYYSALAYSATSSSTQCFATQTVYVVFNTVTHVVSITGTWSLVSTGSLFNGCIGLLTCQNYQLSVWDDRGYSHQFGTGLGCNGGSYSTSWSDFTDTWTWAHGSVSATYSGICGPFLCQVTDTAQADVYIAS